MLTIVCDECGVVLNDGKHGNSTQAMIDDFASMEWWQRVKTPEGIRHRYWFAETPFFRAGKKQTFLLSQNRVV